MKAHVDQDGCISCGLCPSVCPEVFQFNGDEKAEPIVDVVPADCEEAAQEACDGCPVSAIELS